MGIGMSITYKSVYRAKEGKVKKRLDLLIDMDLALKLIEEASRKYGARGISRFVEELLREYFEKQKQEARSKISEIVQSVVQ